MDLARYWTGSDAAKLINIEEDHSFYEAGLLKLNTDKALAMLKWQPCLNYGETMQLTGEWYDYFYRNNPDTSSLHDFSLQQTKAFLQLAADKHLQWMY